MNRKIKLGIAAISFFLFFGIANAKVNLNYSECGNYYQKVTVNNSTSYESTEVCAPDKPNVTKITGEVGVNETFREDTEYCQVEINGTTGDYTCGNVSYSTNATIENKNGSIFVKWLDWSKKIPLEEGDTFFKKFEFECPAKIDTGKSFAECSDYYIGKNQTGDILMETLQGRSVTLKKYWECQDEKEDLKEENLRLEQEKTEAVESREAKDTRLETFREKWKNCRNSTQIKVMEAKNQTEAREEKECAKNVRIPLNNELESCRNSLKWSNIAFFLLIAGLGSFIGYNVFIRGAW